LVIEGGSAGGYTTLAALASGRLRGRHQPLRHRRPGTARGRPQAPATLFAPPAAHIRGRGVSRPLAQQLPHLSSPSSSRATIASCHRRTRRPSSRRSRPGACRSRLPRVRGGPRVPR
jgi:hypothetical protein